MHRLLILYAPDNQEARNSTAAVASSFEQTDLDVVAIAAQKAQFNDVLAADISLYYSAVSDAALLHSDFAEIERALGGVNLAGKMSGLISLGGSKAPRLFRRALKDSNVFIFDEDLELESGTADRDKISMWSERLYRKFKEGIHAAEL